MLSSCSPSSYTYSFPSLHDTISFASSKKPIILLKRQKISNYFSCESRNISCSFAWKRLHNFLRMDLNSRIPDLSGSKTPLQPLWGLQRGTWHQPGLRSWGRCPPPRCAPGGCSSHSSLPTKLHILEKEGGRGKHSWSCWCGMGTGKGVEGSLHRWFLSLVVDLPAAMQSARDLTSSPRKFRGTP